MTNKQISFFLCLSLLILAGCRSSKQTGTSTETETRRSDKEIFALVEEQAFRFKTLTARLNVDLNLPGNQMSSRVDFKMVRDSAFQLSVQPFLGIEIFRIEIGRDSIKVLDRMNKRYVAENYAALKRQTPIEFNFYNLQALFTNRLFVPGEQEISPKHYKRFDYVQQEQGTKTEMRVEDLMKLLYTFTADGEGKLLSTRIDEPTGQYTLQWDYADFRLAGNEKSFPMKMDVHLHKTGDALARISLYFSRVQNDVPVKMDFSIPSKYQRISWQQIMRALIPKKEVK